MILYATSLVITVIFPISLLLAIIAINLVIVIYTFIGGISTVIWTDVWQAIVLLIGSVMIFIWLVKLGIYLATGFTVVMVSYLYYQNFAWHWFAPIGKLTFLVIGYLSSLYIGNNTSAQKAFYRQQKGLILKPNWQLWGLLLFFVIMLLFAWHFESIYLFL